MVGLRSLLRLSPLVGAGQNIADVILSGVWRFARESPCAVEELAL